VTPLSLTQALSAFSAKELGSVGAFFISYIPALVLFFFVWVMVPNLLGARRIYYVFTMYWVMVPNLLGAVVDSK